jgi:asparagine synthase (glutamine-hydrolysing)
MQLMLCWFAHVAVSDVARSQRAARFTQALDGLVPASWTRHDFGGEDWGVTVLHPADRGAFRWPSVETAGPVTAVSLGIPVGVDADGGAAALAKRLLAAEDVHRAVVPPFGLLALDTDRFSLQQDWLGMARVFTGTADGVTAYCTRPGLLATFLHGTPRPDLAGWTSYTVCGHFGGDLSPVAGTRQLRPGERATGRRLPGGGWRLDSELRYAVDDVVAEGLAGQDRPVAEQLDRAADALTRVAAGVPRLYADQITLGLSGGKDSRLIAATLVAADRLPRFLTYQDTAAEGRVAQQLVQLLRDRRGLDPEHVLRFAGAPAKVLNTGLRERARYLRDRYDHQFPSSYLTRPADSPLPPERMSPATYTGAAGELAVGYWYPAAAGPTVTPRQAGMGKLLAGAPAAAIAPAVFAAERDRIEGIFQHAEARGVRGLHLLDYLYLVERMRRWSTSAYTTGMITPFLAPGFVATTFALTPEQKRERLLHTGIIARLVPEWADVPFVSLHTGRSTATRVWEGDGVAAVSDLLDTADGTLAGLMHKPAVEKALRSTRLGGRPDARILQQFTTLAVAAEHLEPETTLPATGSTYARVTARPAAFGPESAPVRLLRRIRHTRFGNRVWTTVRQQVRGR